MAKFYIMGEMNNVTSLNEVILFKKFGFDFEKILSGKTVYEDYEVLPKLFLMRYLGKTVKAFKFLDAIKTDKLECIVFKEISKLMHARTFLSSRFDRILDDLEDIFLIKIKRTITSKSCSKDILEALIDNFSLKKSVSSIATKNMLLAVQLRIDFEKKAISKYDPGSEELDPSKYGTKEVLKINKLINDDYKCYWNQFSNIINSIAHSGDSLIGRLISINKQMIDVARDELGRL